MTPARPLVIIPALNEVGTVRGVVHAVRAAVPSATVLVVDDGSTDATAAEARAAGALVLSLPYTLGVGGAMRAGFRYGVQHGHDAAVQVDGDGQHDPAELPRLLEGLTRSDIVIGARFAGDGDYHVGRARRAAMWLLARSVSRRTGVRLTDVTSGFRACNARAMALFARTYPVEYLGDTVESLLIAGRAGLTVEQIPVVMRQRLHGPSTQPTWRAVAYLVRAILVLVLARLRRPPEVTEATR